MAGDTKHTIRIVDKDGNQSEVTLPGFAMDSTQERLIKSIQSLGKLNPKTAKAYEDLIKETKNTITATEDATDQQKKDAKALQNTVQTVGDKQVSALRQFRVNFADNVGKDMRNTFVAGGNILTAAIKTATVGLAAGAGLLYKSFMDTAEAYRSLAQSGLGGAGASGTEAQDAVASLTLLGMSASEAASMLTSFGRASAVLGKANFSKFISGVANAGSFAADLGLTLEEAAEYAAEEVEMRQSALVGRLRLDNAQSSSVMEAIQATQALAGIMGKSMKDINASGKEFVDNNANLSSFLMTLPEGLREQFATQYGMMGKELGAVGDDVEKLLKPLLNAVLLDTPAQDPNFVAAMNAGGALAQLAGYLEDEGQRIKATGNMSEETRRRIMTNAMQFLRRANEQDRELLNIQMAGGSEIARTAINTMPEIAQAAENLAKYYARLSQEQKDALDPMIIAAANAQNAISSLTGMFTTLKNGVLGQFADPVNAFVNNLTLSDEALEEHNKKRREEIDAMVDGGKITEAKAEELKAALRTKSLFQSLNDGLKKVVDSFMSKFFPNLNEAGDGVSSFVDMLVRNIDYYSEELKKYLDDLKGETFGEKLGNMFKDLFSNVVIPALITALKEAFWALFTHPEVILGLVAAMSGLSLAKTLLTQGIKTVGTWALTKAGLMAAPTATTAATAGTVATAATAGTAATAAGTTGRLAALATKAAPLAKVGGIATAGLMVGKDAFDVGAALYNGEDVKGEDVGGVIGGVLGGAIGLLGGPVGVAIGASLGNMAGNWIGSFFDDDEAESASADIAQQTKEELLQQNGLVAMAIDPDHVREVGRALAFFNAISVADIAAGLAVLNPALAAFYETIQGIRIGFVDNVNNRFQRLVTILKELNVEGLKLPNTTQHLVALADKITAMPIDKIESLAIAFTALTRALASFGDLTTSTTFGRMWDAFTGKRDETEDVIKILNNFANEVDSEKLLKAAQATMAFNAGMSGYAAVPAEPTRTSATGQQTESPTDQVNNAANMNYNNPYNKLGDIEIQLMRLNEKLGDRVLPVLNSIKTNTAEER